MLLARGTSVELPARLRVDIAGDPRPESQGLVLDAAVLGSVVNDERDVVPSGTGVSLPRGAYVRLLTSVTVVRADFSRATLDRRTVFVPAGSVIGIVGKLPDAAGADKGGSSVPLIIGGLGLLALILVLTLSD